jgi:GlpG protein
VNNLTWYPVLRFPIEKDLMPLLRYLEGEQILHHVSEEDGQQQLWIADEPRVLEVAEYATRWMSDEVIIEEPQQTENNAEQTISKLSITAHLFRLLPVSLITILLGFVGTLLVYADDISLQYAEPFLLYRAALENGEYWRLITPVFIHFGIFHILFNSIVLWQVGRRIELVKGASHYLGVIIIVGLLSNTGQLYVTAQNIPFGGLSGVVYGVIGYIAIYQRYIKHPILQFDQSIIAFFIIWLLLGVFGVIDLFIQGSVANTAHVVGLISGAIIGWLTAKNELKETK